MVVVDAIIIILNCLMMKVKHVFVNRWYHGMTHIRYHGDIMAWHHIRYHGDIMVISWHDIAYDIMWYHTISWPWHDIDDDYDMLILDRLKIILLFLLSSDHAQVVCSGPVLLVFSSARLDDIMSERHWIPSKDTTKDIGEWYKIG